jgi:endonuclease G
VHLAFGNPSDAVADLLQPNNYLMEKPSFTLSYNRDKGTGNDRTRLTGLLFFL